MSIKMRAAARDAIPAEHRHGANVIVGAEEWPNYEPLHWKDDPRKTATNFIVTLTVTDGERFAAVELNELNAHRLVKALQEKLSWVRDQDPQEVPMPNFIMPPMSSE